jgi:hypothetical protein
VKSRTSAAAALAASCWLAACDAPTTATSLSASAKASPYPTTAAPSTGVTYTVTNADDTVSTYEYDWRTSFEVQIVEIGGTALNITAVNLAVQQASGGIVITPSGGDREYYRFNSSASGNRLAAHGSSSIGFDVWYDLPNGGKEALITVSLSFRDDDGNTYSTTVQELVSP